MRIATSSVRSIRKRLPAVLQWLVERKPDIMALQKTSAPEAKVPDPGSGGNRLLQCGIRPNLSDGLRGCRPEPAGTAEARGPFSGARLPRGERSSFADREHRTDTVHLRSVRKPAQVWQGAGHRTSGGLAPVLADPRPRAGLRRAAEPVVRGFQHHPGRLSGPLLAIPVLPTVCAVSGLRSPVGGSETHRHGTDSVCPARTGVSRDPPYPTDPGEFRSLAFTYSSPVPNVSPCHIWMVKFQVWDK